MKKIVKTLLLFSFCLFMSSCVININTGYHYDNAEDYSAGNATISGEVRSINVDWISGSITLLPTDASEVSIYENNWESIPERKRVHYFFDSSCGELIIKFCAPIKDISIADFEKDLIIYVPNSYTSLFIEGNTVSADFISSVSCVKTAYINSVSGNLNITSSGNIDRIDYDSVSGDVTINCNALNSFESDTTSGDVFIITNDGNEINCDSVSGDVELNIPSSLGFYVDYNALGKRFSTNVPVRIDDTECYYGDCKLKVEFDSVSGDITINVR